MKPPPKWLSALLRTRDGVYVVNDAQRIVCWNAGAERLLGYHEADVLKRHCYEVIAGRTGGAAHCYANCPVLRTVRRDVAPESFNVKVRTQDGRPLWLNVSIFSYQRNGRYFLVHLLRDVTQEEQHKEALEEILVTLEAHGLGEASPRESRNAAGTASAAVSPSRPAALTSLTRREVEVLALLAEGLTGKEIAGRLGVSPFTVRSHIESILQKTGMHTQAQAVAYAYRARIL